MGTVPPTDIALPFQRPDVLPSQREAPLEEKTFVGESDIGELGATLLVPGPLKPVAGALGAGAGEGFRQWREGEQFDPKKIGAEAGWALVPEVAESAVRGVFRQFARNSPGGISLRTDQAAKEARALPEKVFQPKPADRISDVFEQVRKSGLNIDTEDVAQHLRTLSPGKQADTLNILTSLDREHLTGGRYAQFYQDLLSGKGMAGSSIGELQTMRSHLRQRAEALRNGSPEARQLVRDMQGAVDDAIDFGLTTSTQAASSPQIREMLHGARRDWAHRAAADDLGDMIENKITSSPDLESSVFSLKNLADELRRGRTDASKSINRALDLTPGARDKFNTELREIARLYNRISIPMTDVMGINRLPVIAGARQAIGQLLLTDWGRERFQKAIIDGRGTLSPNALATLTNAALRDTDPRWRKGTTEQPGAEPAGIEARTWGSSPQHRLSQQGGNAHEDCQHAGGCDIIKPGATVFEGATRGLRPHVAARQCL